MTATPIRETGNRARLTREHRARGVAALAGAYASGVGLAVICGWLLDIDWLKGAFVAGIAMKFNAALCYLALGSALILAHAGADSLSRAQSRAVRGLAALAALIAVATLSQHFVGWNLGIDELFVADRRPDLATVSPGRMGIPGSLGILLAAIALWSLEAAARSQRPVRSDVVITMLALAVGLLGLLPLVGFAYGADQLYGVARYTGIAAVTATVLVVLGLGILFARPDREPMRTLLADTLVARLARPGLPALILTVFALGWLRLRLQELGHYDTAFGTALMILLLVVGLGGAVFGAVFAIGRHEGAIRRREAEFHAHFELTAVGNAQTDARTGRFLLVNQAMGAITGYTPHELLQRRFLDVTHPEDRDRTGARLTEVGHGLAPGATIAQRLVRKDGSIRQVSISVTVAERDDDAQPVRTGAVVLDITERMQAEAAAASLTAELERKIEELERIEAQRRLLLESERAARNTAERAVRLSDEFLAMLSHELRTPLNAVLGWAQVLHTTNEAGVWAQGLDAIERGARAQAQLIGDLLDMSRITTGKMRLDVQTVPLGPLVEAAIGALQPAATAKGIAVQRVIDPAADPIQGDPARLQQVLWNLLSNAIKFTPKGGRVQVRVERIDSAVEVSVADTGIGIAADFLPHVFERFRQADSSTTRMHGGLGLGLTIVKHLLDLHGGTVDASSDGEGHGATFTVRLPVAIRAR